MRIFLTSVTFGMVVSCIQCSYSPIDIENNFLDDTSESMQRFCALSQKQRENFRSCLLENGVEESSLHYRNCAQQVKFFYTAEEIDKFVCYTSSEKEYEQFLKCFICAGNALNRDLPKRVPVIQKCLSKEEEEGHDF